MSDGRAPAPPKVDGLSIRDGQFAWEPRPLVVVVSGPSGAGKDSVIRRLEQLHGSIHFVVTATSRPAREGEVAGRDYHFFTGEEFAARIGRGEFLEHALVYGDYKGVPRWEIDRALQSGQDAIMRVDVQGARTLRDALPEAVFVFIMAESEDEHLHRLRGRGSEDEESLRARREQLWRELDYLPEFDYLVINHRDRLDEAAAELYGIVKSEKLRVRRGARG